MSVTLNYLGENLESLRYAFSRKPKTLKLQNTIDHCRVQ